MNKIMVIFSELFHGGAEKQFRELISRIDKNLFEVVAVSAGALGGKKEEPNIIEFRRKNPNINFYFLERIYVPKGIINKIKVSFDFNKQMYGIVQKEMPDIVVVYNGIELSASKVYKKSGAKVIFSERESGDRGFIKLLRYKYYFRNVDRVVCNSKQAKRYYQSRGITSDYIPNGIEESNVLQKEKSEIFNIVVPARIAKIKNQELVIEAIKNINRVNIKVTFVGKHEDKVYLSYLKSLIEKYDLASKVFFSHFTGNIQSIYENADLVILPSKMEGLSNVILESYMFGRICIISDIPMNRDVANVNQQFFSAEDCQKLQELIIDMINRDSSINEREICDNHLYVKRLFSMNAMVESYKKLFFNLLEG